MSQAYHDHAAHLDKFAMLAIHDSSVKSFKEMDEHLDGVKREYWKGEDLPFPVLLDKNSETEELFGISAHPTQILIDPDGNIVGESSLAALEKELPPLTADILLARHLDIQKNVYWSWDSSQTVETAMKYVKGQTQLEIELDSESAKEMELSLNSKLPGFVEGYGITLRSFEQMLLRPNGLAVEPSEDGKSLVLTKNTRSREPLSHLQQLHQSELEQRIKTQTDRPAKVEESLGSSESDRPDNETAESENEKRDEDAETSDQKIDPLEIDEIELQAAIKKIASHFDLPMGIDHQAIVQAGTKVSGRIRNEALKKTLNEMLHPVGLKVIIKFEMVLIAKIE